MNAQHARADALVRHSCELCSRDGQLVCQSVKHNPTNPASPWVFRYYLCRWHRAAWNRQRIDCQRKMTVLEYVDDKTLLANSAMRINEAAKAGKGAKE